MQGEKFYSTGSSFADWLAVKAIHPEGHVVLVILPAKAEGVKSSTIGTVLDNAQPQVARLNSIKLLLHPFLIFDERKLTTQPSYRGAYSQLLQVAIDVGIAEAAFSDTISAVKRARPIVDAQVEKASEEHYTLQEVGKSAVLLGCCDLLLDDAAEYLMNLIN